MPKDPTKRHLRTNRKSWKSRFASARMSSTGAGRGTATTSRLASRRGKITQKKPPIAPDHWRKQQKAPLGLFYFGDVGISGANAGTASPGSSESFLPMLPPCLQRVRSLKRIGPKSSSPSHSPGTHNRTSQSPGRYGRDAKQGD